MALPAPLSRRLRDKLGTDAGEDLVNWLDEMRAARGELEKQTAQTFETCRRLETRMEELTNELRSVEVRLTQRIHGVEVKLGDVKADLMKWSFVFWCGAVAAIAALARVLRG